MYDKNCSGDFLACNRALIVGGELLKLLAPVDLLTDALIPSVSTFEIVQFNLSSSATWDFSRDGVNWVAVPAATPVQLPISRMITRGLAGGVVSVPNLWVRGAGTLAIVAFGDVRRAGPVA
jgi:hypothetical protein